MSLYLLSSRVCCVALKSLRKIPLHLLIPLRRVTLGIVSLGPLYVCEALLFLILDEGYFMSSSSQDLFTSQYGVSVSHDPFNGTSRVRTIATSQMFKSKKNYCFDF